MPWWSATPKLPDPTPETLVTSIDPTQTAATSGDGDIDTPLQPVTGRQRIEAMDILRGFALIGVLMMNIEWFNRPITELPRFDFSLSGLDHAASFLVMLLVQGKFYKLFSLLFGMGFAIMLTRARERGQAFTGVFLRRMLALWCLGVMHLVFFWGGDILHDYAVGGLLLFGWFKLWGRGAFLHFDNPDSIGRFGLGWMALPFIGMTVAGIGYGVLHDTGFLKSRYEERIEILAQGQARLEQARANGIDLAADEDEDEPADAAGDAAADDAPLDPESVQARAWRIEKGSQARARDLARRAKRSNDEIRALAHGSYAEATVFRARHLGENLGRSVFFSLFILLPIFITGYWLVVSGRIRHPEQHRGFFRTLMYVGVGIGLPVSLGSALITINPAVEEIQQVGGVAAMMFEFAQYLLAAGYLGLVVTLVMSPFWRRLIAWLAPLGRMALTNYLMQSLILSTIFYGYGFGQFGQIPRGPQMLVAAAIIALQWAFSRLWLRTFRFGPLEWLWRCFTYWKMQPLRRAAA